MSHITLSQSSQSTVSGLPMFHQTMMSSTSKPIPVIIQICAAKVLSKLYAMTESSQLYIISKAGFGLYISLLFRSSDLKALSNRILTSV
ncbi:hypothetical protein Bca52824_074273 [Brassica carinata]|uniref:Uncharacterized protein n=1 Tax=Brassica carinata TaxID=52824 RepID=A0A8X7PSQ0_BRACI|nr:hypothetical protein Bca52824_074273 [Brassica carinata]